MGHLGEKLISFVSWCLILLAAGLTEDIRQIVMFFLGGCAALLTAAHKLQEMYYKYKDRKKAEKK